MFLHDHGETSYGLVQRPSKVKPGDADLKFRTAARVAVTRCGLRGRQGGGRKSVDESRGPWAPALRGPFLTKVQSIRSPPGLRCLHPRVRIGWVKNTLGPRRPASATSGKMPALGREAAGLALRRDVQRLESAAAPPRGEGGSLAVGNRNPVGGTGGVLRRTLGPSATARAGRGGPAPR